MLSYQVVNDKLVLTIIDGETVVTETLTLEDVWWMANDFVTILEASDANIPS